jgi:hypothetical protein
MSARHPRRIVTGPYERLEELQRYGMIVPIPIALDACAEGVGVANRTGAPLAGTPLIANEHEPA